MGGGADPRIMNGHGPDGEAGDRSETREPNGFDGIAPDTVIIGTGDGRVIEGGAFEGGTIELESADATTTDSAPLRPGSRYEASTVLVDQAHQKIPVYFTAQAIPSPEAGGSYVVAQFRDLRKSAAERLLADQEAVIASLKRGHHLGQLCHQIAVMIERSLGVSATCWLSIVSPDDDLEPVITVVSQPRSWPKRPRRWPPPARSRPNASPRSGVSAVAWPIVFVTTVSATSGMCRS